VAPPRPTPRLFFSVRRVWFLSGFAFFFFYEAALPLSRPCSLLFLRVWCWRTPPIFPDVFCPLFLSFFFWFVFGANHSSSACRVRILPHQPFSSFFPFSFCSDVPFLARFFSFYIAGWTVSSCPNLSLGGYQCCLRPLLFFSVLRPSRDSNPLNPSPPPLLRDLFGALTPFPLVFFPFWLIVCSVLTSVSTLFPILWTWLFRPSPFAGLAFFCLVTPSGTFSLTHSRRAGPPISHLEYFYYPRSPPSTFSFCPNPVFGSSSPPLW